MKTFPALLTLFLLTVGSFQRFTHSTDLSPGNPTQTVDESREVESLTTQGDDKFAQQRREMVKEQIADRGIKDAAALRAMEAVPRHEFVPESYREHPRV